jgi:hypothetical protein
MRCPLQDAAAKHERTVKVPAPRLAPVTWPRRRVTGDTILHFTRPVEPAALIGIQSVVPTHGVARIVSAVTVSRDVCHGGLPPSRIHSRHGDKKREPTKLKQAVQ